jgi:hypothetical protein
MIDAELAWARSSKVRENREVDPCYAHSYRGFIDVRSEGFFGSKGVWLS